MSKHIVFYFYNILLNSSFLKKKFLKKQNKTKNLLYKVLLFSHLGGSVG